MSSSASESGSGSGSSSKSSDSGSAVHSATERMAKLRHIRDELSITIATVKDLRSLEGFDIVFLADDSSSMREPCKPGPALESRTGASNSEDGAFDVTPTRWLECENMALRLLHLGSALDTDGVDVYFLNRKGKQNVVSATEMRSYFKKEPHGHTPLVSALERIMKDRRAKQREDSDFQGEKKLLIVILTDGLPTEHYEGEHKDKHAAKSKDKGKGKGKGVTITVGGSRASGHKVSKASMPSSKASKASKASRKKISEAQILSRENLAAIEEMEGKMKRKYAEPAWLFRGKVTELIAAGVHLSFILCTDDDSVAAYYKLLDGLLPNIDVTDDYATEAAEVAANGRELTRGDYVVKGLLGATDPKWDAFDGQ